jgi:hypothetical protein
MVTASVKKMAPIGMVGVVGLGIMGSAMAANLVKAGFEVYGYDPVAKAGTRLKKAGGHPLAAPSNKNKQNPTANSVSPSLPNLSSPSPSSPHTWFSLLGCAAAHQSPIRIKACAPCGSWPLAALAAPENLLFPTASI